MHGPEQLHCACTNTTTGPTNAYIHQPANSINSQKHYDTPGIESPRRRLQIQPTLLRILEWEPHSISKPHKQPRYTPYSSPCPSGDGERTKPPQVQPSQAKSRGSDCNARRSLRRCDGRYPRQGFIRTTQKKQPGMPSRVSILVAWFCLCCPPCCPHAVREPHSQLTVPCYVVRA